MLYELIGYIASVLVALSLMMSSILRLRIINLVGSSLFAIYGALIGAWPVAIVNLFIAGVNVFFLGRIYSTKEYFRLLEVRRESEYLQHFLELNRADIERHQPQFAGVAPQHDIVLFVLRDVVPAGLFVGELRDDGALLVQLDYVLPNYRDFKIGRFLFRDHADFFRARGVRRILSPPGTRVHADYLRRMGFVPAGDGMLAYPLV